MASGMGCGQSLARSECLSFTTCSHHQDINSLAVSPNDKLLATGSQDRTAKLWALPQCQLLGVFSGHRRGLWNVQFSPTDQVLATASADGTIKLWALQDFSCLKVSVSPCPVSPSGHASYS